MTKSELIQGLAPYPDDTKIVLVLEDGKSSQVSALCFGGDVPTKRFGIFADSKLQPADAVGGL
jgi:hypothetical protein